VDVQQILEKQEKYIWGIWNIYERPISFVKGHGMYVWDSEGNKYLDMFGGMLTLSTGHCHPKVVEAVVKQRRTSSLNPVSIPT
jgi:4-aminobutyrate aminotransferase-like enzyme